jgi:TRAP-type C4-dicarboxylate transport system permease small subunit
LAGGRARPLWWRAVLALWRAVLAATMITMTVSVALGVISRYVFDAPFFWTEEVARYALVWMTFLGSAELFRYRGGHINVEVLVQALPRMPRRVVLITVDLVVLAVLLAVGVGGYVLMTASSLSVSASLGIPMPWIYAVIPVSAVIAIGTLVAQMCWPADRS